MKKVLSIALLVVLVVSVLTIVSSAAEQPTYWEISSECLVKAKALDDGTVTTFKAVSSENDVDGLLVGLPTDATVGDEFFEAKEGYYFLYFDAKGQELYYEDEHLGTTDYIVVYDEYDNEVAKYSIVTYGDADGDGVFDVIDSAFAALCFKEFITAEEKPALYEAMKPRIGADDEKVVVDDYQQIVNNTFKDEETLENNPNFKGRKKLVDQSLSYESVIYCCDGIAKNAPVVASDDFKKVIKVTYNGETEIPKEPGVYAVSVIVPESEEYLVIPKTVDLGFMVIAPKDSVGNYNIAVDNSAKTITVNIENAYTSNATLVADFEKWLNNTCTLKVASSSNPSTIASKLPNRSFNKYTNQSTVLQTAGVTGVLGSYLPDDNTLWKNNTAQNTTAFSVSANGLTYSYTVVFKQDAKTIENAIYKMRNTIAEAGRGQRTAVPTTNCASNYLKFVNGYPTISIAVNDGSAEFTTGLQSTGLKTMLLGYVDAVSIKSATSASGISSANIVSLYDSSDYNYKRFSAYKSADLSSLSNKLRFAKLVNKVTGIGYMTLAMGNMSSTVGTKGYCDYQCVESTRGLRYNDTYYMEYINYDAKQHSHYTVTTSATNGTVSVDSKYLERFAVNEFFYVTTKANSGYELDTVTVVNSSTGAVIAPDSTGRYIMPAANVTVTATFKPVS